MRCSDTQLHGLPVKTEGGQPVGRLRELVVDTVSHEVVQYVVVRLGALSRLLPKELLVGRDQVVSLNDERMIVLDSAVDERAVKTKVAPSSVPESGAALGRTMR